MKIVYISNSIIPSRTANSIHVMKMCQAFADNGHEVVLLAPNRYKEYENGVDDVYEYYGVRKNFKIQKFYYKYMKGKVFFQLFSILKILQKIQPELVYGRYTPGCLISSIFNYKTIFESHSPIWHSGFLDKFSFEIMKKMPSFKKLVVISNALKNMYLENRYLINDKIQVAHDGADEVIDFENKVELLGDKNSLKVGYVGHLYKGKGIEVIASIADKVSEGIEFHIVGGLEKDIQFWKERINSKNVFFYGFVPQKEVGGYINALDVCLLPNQKVVLPHGAKDNSHNISDFTSPLKMFEYMAHKKAIVCSDIQVLREVLNEENSILVDPENAKEWIEAIERLKDNETRDYIACKSYDNFLKYYRWKERAVNVVK